MRYAVLRLLSLFLVACGFATGAWAQTGVIRGTVRDAGGGPLPGVNVTLGGTPRGTATDTDGRYRLAHLPPGAYTVAASAVGFRREERRVTLAPGDTLTVDFTLREIVLRSGEVVVTAARRGQLSSTVPASLTTLTPRELDVRNVVALDDALRFVPGVQVQGNQVNVRGSSGFAYNTGSRVLLLLDGVPLLLPDTDGLPFDALPFARIARVEVLKGPGSALYGSGALGGVINVITKPYPEEPETSVRLFGGAYEPVRYAVWRERWADASRARPFGGAAFSHARRFGEKLGLWVNLAYRADAGYLHFGKLWLFQGYAKVGWRPRPALRLDVLGGMLARKKDNFLFWNGGRDALNPGNLSFDPDAAPAGTNDAFNNQFSLLPTFTHLVGPTFFYTLKARLFAVLIRPIDDATGRIKPVSDGTLGFRYGGEAQINWQPRPGRNLTAGISADANATRSSFFVTNDGDELGGQPEGAVFAQWEHAATDRLHLVAGLRFDGYRIDAAETVTKLSPRLSAAYTAGRRLTVRAAFGQGFRVPSLAERFTDNRDFVPIVRNLTLRPETSTSVEVGLRSLVPLSRTSGAQFDLALFWNAYENLIEPKFVPDMRAFQFVNLTRARIRGLEASVDAGLAGERVKVRLGYTFLDADDLTDRLPLPFRPRHLFIASFDARVAGPFEAGFDFRFADRPERVDSDFTRFVPDADLLVDTRVLDLRLGVRRRGLRAALLVKNALEYYYLERPAYLAPPRHFILQLQADF